MRSTTNNTNDRNNTNNRKIENLDFLSTFPSLQGKFSRLQERGCAKLHSEDSQPAATLFALKRPVASRQTRRNATG